MARGFGRLGTWGRRWLYRPTRPALPSQARPVGPGPLHADPLEMSVPLQPVQQCLVAGRGRGKLPIAKLTTYGVERRSVVGLAVGIDTARDNRRRWWSCLSLPSFFRLPG